MDLIQKAKLMLPNMPDEVFNKWLLPIIKDHNSWPYNNVFSQHPSLQWKRYFSLFDLNDISNCQWNKSQLSFDQWCLDTVSNKTIAALIQSNTNPFSTVTFNVRDTKARFFGFVKEIQNTGKIPAPIIVLHTDDGLRILDGNHRLSALTYLRLRGQISCETWFGYPNV